MTTTETVLIVEDEPGLRDGLAEAVATLGYRVLTAGGIGEAAGGTAAPPPAAARAWPLPSSSSANGTPNKICPAPGPAWSCLDVGPPRML